MAIRASISKGYIWRPGLIGVAALMASGWFLYDGMVKYPRIQAIWNAYNQIAHEHPDDPVVAARLWAEHAREHGWPTDPPKARMEDKDILTQKIIAGITAPIGLLFCISFLRSVGRWVEADEQGLTTRSGQRVPYDAIKSVDKSRWQNKGIAVVHYQIEDKSGRITLDDWKFDREPTKRILEQVEEHMPGGGDADAEPSSAPDQADA